MVRFFDNVEIGFVSLFNTILIVLVLRAYMKVLELLSDRSYQHKYVLEKIIGHVMGRSREDIVRHYDDKLLQDHLGQIQSLYDRYSVDHYPLEYILGYVEYGWLRFKVSEATIIPRPETEFMIEVVREYLDQLIINNDQLTIDENSQLLISNSQLILVDVGTWSGVLWLSILSSHGKIISQTLLIDVSEDALEVARENYATLAAHWNIDKGAQVDIVKGNLLSPLASSLQEWLWQDIVITANLPYIPDEDFDTNPDRNLKHEPRVAFVGGDDGLDLYREMFDQIKRWMSSSKDNLWSESFNSSHSIVMFLEMMTWQVEILTSEFDRLEFEEVRTFHANIRIVKATITH